MSDRIRPTPEATARVRNLRGKAILAFLDEVSTGSVRKLVPIFPPVPGFRKNSEAGIKQRKIALAKLLTNRVDDRDHTALYVMWRAWAREHLGNPDNIAQLIDELEELDHHDHLESDSPTVTAITALFSALKALSLENKCPREKIARFFEFSPFSATVAITDLIQSSKSAADIERDTALSTLPKRLHDDELEIESINARLKSLTARIETAASELADTKAKVADHRATLRSIKESGDRYEAQFAEALTSLERTAQAATRLERAFEELEQTSAAVKRGSGERAQIDQRITSVEIALTQAIAAEVEPLRKKLAGIVPVGADALDSVIKEVQVLAGQLTTLSQTALSKDDIQSIHDRVINLEQHAITLPAPQRDYDVKILGPSTGDGVLRAGAHALPIQPIAPGIAKDSKTLDTSGKIIGNLSTALQSLGLRTSAADSFAKEMAAAILSNQIIFLKGALSHATACVCARALSYNHASTISVPAGLTDGVVFRSALETLSLAKGGDVTAAVLDGFNRSSLDATKDVLAEFSTDQNLWGRPRVIFFATLLQGLASIPVEPEYLEFGPVFDLDYLEWRARPDANAAVIGGILPSAAEEALRKEVDSAAADIEEVIRLVRKFLPKSNVRIERTLAAAFRALHHLRSEKHGPTHLQSLAFGWLAPLWHALGVTKEQADSELDGGKCDSDKPDTRLANILSSEEFTVRGSS
jgi:hypothetical protein